MKKVMFSLGLLCVGFSVSISAASVKSGAGAVTTSNNNTSATTGTNQPYTVVYANMPKVAANSTEFKKEKEKLEATFTSKAEAIKKLETEFQTKLQQLQASAKDLTESAREKRQEELARMQGEIEMKKRNIQAFMEAEAAKLEERLLAKIDVVREKMGWDMINPMAVSHSPRCDKTTDITIALNEQYAKSSAAKA